MSSFNKDRILEKIQKCFALSKSSNPNESALALRQAHKLLEKYNLTMSEVELSDISNEDSFIRKSAIKHYESTLAVVIANAFDCVASFKDVYDKRLKRKIVIVFSGYSSDVTVANYAFEVLFRQLKQARKEYLKSIRLSFPSSKRQKLADNFCLGWAQSVYNIVEKISPVNKNKIEKIRQKFEFTKTKKRGPQGLDYENYIAMMEGKEKGDDAKIWNATTNESEKRKYLE